MLRARAQPDLKSGRFPRGSCYDTFPDLVCNEWNLVTEVDYYGTGATPITSKLAYDSLGRLVWSEDPVTKSVDVEHDAAGRTRKTTLHPRTGSTDPAIVLETIFDDTPSDLDLAPIVTRKDALGNPSHYETDAGGRLAQRQLPGWQVGNGVKTWTYSYDTEGRLLSWIDGSGAEIKIGYDALKRPTSRWLASQGAQTLSLICTNETFAYD